MKFTKEELEMISTAVTDYQINKYYFKESLNVKKFGSIDAFIAESDKLDKTIEAAKTLLQKINDRISEIEHEDTEKSI